MNNIIRIIGTNKGAIGLIVILFMLSLALSGTAFACGMHSEGSEQTAEEVSQS